MRKIFQYTLFLICIFLLSVSYIAGESAKDIIKQGIEANKKREWERAIGLFKEGLRMDSSLVDGHYGMAFAYISMGKIERSFLGIAEKLKVKGEAGESFYRLGEAYSEKSLNEEASLCFGEAVRLKYEPVKSLLALGRSLLRRGLVDEAQVRFEQALEIEPSNMTAKAERARCLVDKGNFAGAEKEYREILKTHPNFAVAHLGLAKSLERQNKPNDAYSEYKKAVEVDPSHPEAHYELGIFFLNYFGDKKVLDAIIEFEKYTQIRSRDPIGFYQLAKAYQLRRDCLKGKEAASKSVALDSTNDAAWELKGTFLYDCKSYEEACKAFNKALEIAPLESARWVKLGRSYQGWAGMVEKTDSLKAQEKFSLGHSAFLKAIKLDEKNGDALFGLASCLYSLKKYDESIEAYGKYTSIFPNNPLGWYNLAFNHIAKKDYEKAVASLEKATQIKSDHLPSLLSLARLYGYLAQTKKDNELLRKAKETYEKVLKLDPENKDAKDELKKLPTRV